jgi:membrane protease subunit (stomatin/prohibitin family)
MRGRGAALVIGMRAGERRAQEAQAQQAAAQEAPAPAAAAPAAAPASDDTTTQLKKLADLHAQGVLTDEEFAASKKKLLGI